jgi:hypothetical protein
MKARARGEDTSSEPESSKGDNEEEDEDGKELEVTPPPHSLPPEDLPSLGDIFNRQAGISVDVGQPKCSQMETLLLASPLPQPHLILVSPTL